MGLIDLHADALGIHEFHIIRSHAFCFLEVAKQGVADCFNGM